MLGLIGGLKLFDQVFSTTGGGPAGQTKTISVLIYELFSQFGFYGQSAAMAVLLAVAVALLSLVQFAILRRQERRSSLRHPGRGASPHTRCPTAARWYS
jgi:raffinose/stachyose/melibiose transport system permease protein